MTSASWKPLRHNQSLDGLRGIAILLVLLHHASRHFPGGFVGVDLFFVLSGFLITHLMVDEFARSDRIHLLRFYGRRFLRLLPAVTTFLACYAVANVILRVDKPQTAWSSITAVLFYFMNVKLMLGQPVSDLLGHLWSLSLEEQFYVVWPFMLIVLLKCRAPRDGAPAPAIAPIVAFGLALLSLSTEVFGRASQVYLYFGPASRAYALLLGSGIALLAAVGQDRFRRVVTGFRQGMGISLAILIVGAIILPSPFSVSYHQTESLPVILASGIIVAEGAYGPPSRWLMLLANPGLAWLGRISYSLYIWHVPVFLLLKDVWHVPPLPRLVLGLTISVAIAAASRYWVEAYFLRLKTALR
jgi:peptidoglycan/LPS O-acetylase OafA/YrhL